MSYQKLYDNFRQIQHIKQMNPYYSEEQVKLKQQIEYPKFNNDLEYQQYKHKNRLTIKEGQYDLQFHNYFQNPNNQTPRQNAKITPEVDNPISINQTTKIDQERKIQQIYHKVHPDDTLQGLSLLYDVPVRKIQQRNNISSTQIYFLKSVIIPHPKFIPEIQQKNVQDIKIRDFMGYLERNDRSEKTARYYLSENDWNVDDAIKQYQNDLQWQKNQKQIHFETYVRAREGSNTGRIKSRDQVFFQNIQMSQMGKAQLKRQ